MMGCLRQDTATGGNTEGHSQRQTGMRTFAVLLITTAAFAQDVGTNVKQPVIDYYDSISDYFRQSRRAVDLIAHKGIPDEEIPAVLYIARRSSASPNQVIEARKAGKSFEDIARANHVNLAGNDFVTEATLSFWLSIMDAHVIKYGPSGIKGQASSKLISNSAAPGPRLHEAASLLVYEGPKNGFRPYRLS